MEHSCTLVSFSWNSYVPLPAQHNAADKIKLFQAALVGLVLEGELLTTDSWGL